LEQIEEVVMDADRRGSKRETMEQLYYATSSWSEHRAPAEVTIRRRKPVPIADDVDAVSSRNTLWSALKSRLLQSRKDDSTSRF
jgi:hypothetical protein